MPRILPAAQLYCYLVPKVKKANYFRNDVLGCTKWKPKQ